MSTTGDELEEAKTLTRHQLASIVWPVRSPKDDGSFVDEFRSHIRNKFNEPSAEKFNRELNEFAHLRNVAISCLREDAIRDNNSLKNLKKYYCQLACMLVRFKDCGAKFSWKDSFGRGANEGDLEFELNNIMYNIAAIHASLGAKITRTDETLAREALTHFSNALWWVTELRDNRTGAKPKEMGHDLLTFFHHVLKGEAQECVLLKAISSVREMKPENVAKISSQVASDFDVAAKLAQTPLYTDPLKEIMSGASLLHNWRATTEFKRNFYSGLSQLLCGLSHSDDVAKEIGKRIARLQLSVRFLEGCKKVIPDTLESAISKAAFDRVDAFARKKLEKSIRFNDNVYHASIPSPDTLPPIDGKLLISPAAFSISSMPEFKDVFSNLVTIESVQVNSIYSQRKDDLSRQIKTQVSRQDEELAQMMSQISLDRRSMKLPRVQAPDELVNICAELGMNPNVVDEVLTKLETLDDKSEEIQNMLNGIQDLLRQRPNRQFEDELKRYRSTHEDALRTTQSLHKQLDRDLKQKIQQMATTSDPLKLLPQFEQQQQQGDDGDEIIKKMEKLFDKVDEMKQQRTSLLNQLTQSLDQDDVIKHVVTATSEHELKGVFDKEIQKHQRYIEPLMSNLKIQNEILDTLERVNQQYGKLKYELHKKQTKMNESVDSLKKCYAQFKATSEGIDQGLAYQVKMVDLVRKFYSKVQASHDLNDLLN